MDALQQLNASLAGRYVIDREIGRGGMATVYLARDVRHDRRVAVKVLNPELGAVLGVERFLAEIRVTANLQHPNLLALFDSGEATTGVAGDGTLLFYVMPFVEGESLRARLEREKQLPIDEALRIATSVASALDYAHRHGVIHRDLKPENILLHEGQPLVADFGIALAVSNAGGGRITQTGLSLGTPQYMSPEQATGDRQIDGRTDVYSLGAVLYEMLTGEPPHTGATAQAIIARVITDKARSARSTRDTVPEHVDFALERSLAKLPADRWPTAQAFAEALLARGVTVPGGVSTPGSLWGKPAPRHGRRTLLAVTGAAAILFGALGWFAARRSLPEPVVRRYALDLPDSLEISHRGGAEFSPDGSLFAFVARTANDTAFRLWVKRRDAHDAAPLARARHPRGFTFSPDSRWIAYVASANGPNQLYKIPVTGGVPVRLADSVISGSQQPAWLDHGEIVYASGPQAGRELRAVPDTGGTWRVVTRADTSTFTMPSVIPGTRKLLATECLAGICGVRRVVLVDVETGARSVIANDMMRARWSPTGHVVMLSRDGTLYALAVNPRTMQAAGQPVPVMSTVFLNAEAAQFALDRAGTLTILHGVGGEEADKHTLHWVDRRGASTPLDTAWVPRLGGAALQGAQWSVSADGRRLALGLTTGPAFTAIWTRPLPSGPVSRLAFHAGGTTSEIRPKFTPDGRITYFVTEREGWALYRMSATGSGTPELLHPASRRLETVDWSRDQKWMVFTARGPNGSRDIQVMQVGVDSVPRALLASQYTEQHPVLSPDGKWIAYQSNETGTYQVFVRPFPDVESGKWQVSDGAGSRNPIWAPGSRELFYIDDLGRRALMVVPIATSPEFSAAPPRVLFALPADAYPYFFATLDGQRFLIARQVPVPPEARPPLVITENWTLELKRLLAPR